MMKIRESVKNIEILKDARDALQGFFREIPFIHAEFLGDFSHSNLIDSGYDDFVRIRLPAGDIVAAIVIKSSGEIGVVRQEIQKILSWRNHFINSGIETSDAFVKRQIHQNLLGLNEHGLSKIETGDVFIKRVLWGNPSRIIKKDGNQLNTSAQDEESNEIWHRTLQNSDTVNSPNPWSPFSSSLPYGIFVAPYISPNAAKLCRELSIGYCDFAGNCFLSFGQVYILRENWPDPNKKTQTISLWSPKAQRVLRVLLENPYRIWKTQSLSEEARVSVGLISNVRNQLEDREWIEDKEGGFVLIEPWALLHEWASNYKIKKQNVHLFYSLDDASDIEAKLSQQNKVNDKREEQLALTGFSAAAHVAPYAKYTQATAYVLEDIFTEVVDNLELRHTESGANVRLIKPYDEGVFYHSQLHEGFPIVCNTQLYLDLQALGGRGKDAADYLLDTKLRPRWNKN